MRITTLNLSMAAGLFVWNFTVLFAAPAIPATSAQRAAIDSIIRKLPEFEALVGKKNKIVASQFLLYKDDDGGDPKSELVDTLHFDYTTGKTIQTTYNLTSKKLVAIHALAAYPTPLAETEQDLARKLARDKDERVRKLLIKYPNDRIELSELIPVISKPNHKHFGKRLVILFYRPMDNVEDTVSVTVNLTDETVESR